MSTGSGGGHPVSEFTGQFCGSEPMEADRPETPNFNMITNDEDTQVDDLQFSQSSDTGGAPVSLSQPEIDAWGRLASNSGVLELMPRALRNGVLNEYIIGRSSSSDVIADYVSISSQHCRLWCEPDSHVERASSPERLTPVVTTALVDDRADSPMRVFVEDNSQNGTFITTSNQSTVVTLRRGERRQLRSGDQVSLLSPSVIRDRSTASAAATVEDRASILNNSNNSSSKHGPIPAFASFVFCDLQRNRLMPPPEPPASAHRLGGHFRGVVGSSGGQQGQGANGARRCVRELYEIHDRRKEDALGEEQCGVVYRAVERATQREWAVKVVKLTAAQLLRHDGSEAELVAELKREAEIMKEVEGHPNILKLRDFFGPPDEPGHLYFVMELVSGGDLLDYVMNHGPFEETMAKRFMRQLLGAVEHLHHKRIVHRDLKPENILLDFSGCDDDGGSEGGGGGGGTSGVSGGGGMSVKITDFGLAKQNTNEGLKTFCGTPQYFAPEVLKRWGTVRGVGRYGPEADMWSVGVVLHVVLTGRNPFNDEATMWEQIAQARYTLDDPDWSGVSDAAKHLVRRLLTKDPALRVTAAEATKHPWLTTSDGVAVDPSLLTMPTAAAPLPAVVSSRASSFASSSSSSSSRGRVGAGAGGTGRGKDGNSRDNKGGAGSKRKAGGAETETRSALQFQPANTMALPRQQQQKQRHAGASAFAAAPPPLHSSHLVSSSSSSLFQAPPPAKRVGTQKNGKSGKLSANSPPPASSSSAATATTTASSSSSSSANQPPPPPPPPASASRPLSRSLSSELAKSDTAHQPSSSSASANASDAHPRAAACFDGGGGGDGSGGSEDYGDEIDEYSSEEEKATGIFGYRKPRKVMHVDVEGHRRSVDKPDEVKALLTSPPRKPSKKQQQRRVFEEGRDASPAAAEVRGERRTGGTGASSHSSASSSCSSLAKADQAVGTSTGNGSDGEEGGSLGVGGRRGSNGLPVFAPSSSPASSSSSSSSSCLESSPQDKPLQLAGDAAARAPNTAAADTPPPSATASTAPTSASASVPEGGNTAPRAKHASTKNSSSGSSGGGGSGGRRSINDVLGKQRKSVAESPPTSGTFTKPGEAAAASALPDQDRENLCVSTSAVDSGGGGGGAPLRAALGNTQVAAERSTLIVDDAANNPSTNSNKNGAAAFSVGTASAASGNAAKGQRSMTAFFSKRPRTS